ncbi:MAG: YggS family pyridoxal phosphate-dependent enzyme [Clostridia bacterium]|nr:YggS family pyridoxal phosphate-dependent enzyme [Clostridia bacterium]
MTEKSSFDARLLCITENYKEITENIASAAVRSGRDPSAVRFMAVTKTVEPVYINHALSLGIGLIGENKVQELLSKLEYLEKKDVEKHIIGHLQSNKVRKIIREVSMVQSLDSVSLAREISRQAGLNGLNMDVLLEVNIGEEASKTGFLYEETSSAAAEIAELPGVTVRGLMAVPPLDAEEEALRGYFRRMRTLFETLKSGNPAFDTLSLGMSGDYITAIEEGATLVRIGSALFGARRY